MLLRFASIHLSSLDNCGSCTRGWYQQVGAPLPICTSLSAIAYRLRGPFSAWSYTVVLVVISNIAAPLGVRRGAGGSTRPYTFTTHHWLPPSPRRLSARLAGAATPPRRWKRRRRDDAGSTFHV